MVIRVLVIRCVFQVVGGRRDKGKRVCFLVEIVGQVGLSEEKGVEGGF